MGYALPLRNAIVFLGVDMYQKFVGQTPVVLTIIDYVPGH